MTSDRDDERRQRWVAAAAIALLVLLPLVGALFVTAPVPVDEPVEEAPREAPPPAAAVPAEDEPPAVAGPWRYTAGGEVWSTPVRIGGLAVVGDDGGTLHAVDLASGTARWTFDAAGPLRTAALALPSAAGDRTVFTDGAGTVRALEAASGEVVWSRSLGSGVSAPARAPGTETIVVGTAEGVAALSVGDGDVRWRRSVGEVAAAPAASQERVVVATADGRVVGVGTERGRLLWTFATRSTLGIAPLLTEDGERALVLTDDGRLFALDALRGLELWRAQVGEFVGAAPALDPSNGSVILGGADGALRAYGLERGLLLWRRGLAQAVRGTPFVEHRDGATRAWVQGGDHHLAVVDAASGRPQLLLAVEGWISSPPTVAPASEAHVERVVFTTSEGSVHGVPVDRAHPVPRADEPPAEVQIRVDPAYRERPPGLAWERTYDGPILAAPAIGGARVVVAAADRLVALDRRTGDEIWSVAAPEGGRFEGRPASTKARSGGDRILAPLRFPAPRGRGSGAVLAVDSREGDVLWTARVGGPVLSTPAWSAAGGVAVFGSHDTKIYGVDGETGDVRWSHATEGIVESSAALVDGIAVIGSCDGTVHALDAESGRLLWRFDAVDCVLSDVRVEKGVAYVGDVRGNVYALDPAVGGELWRFAIDGAVGRRPALDLGMVYVAGADHRLWALGTTTGRALWSRDLGGPSRSGVVVDLGIAYAGSRSDRGAGRLHGVNAVNGEPLWHLRTLRPVHDVAFSDGFLFAVDGDRGGGAVYALALP